MLTADAEIVELAERMRAAQKKYFSGMGTGRRDPVALAQARELERELDRALAERRHDAEIVRQYSFNF
jgi:hypothetical protein